MKLIDKDRVAAEIKKKLQDLIACKKDALCPEERSISQAKINMCKEILSFLDTIETKETDLIINTVIAECCDWLAICTDLNHDLIEDCRNLMLAVKEEQCETEKVK